MLPLLFRGLNKTTSSYSLSKIEIMEGEKMSNNMNYSYGTKTNQSVVVEHDIVLNGRKLLEINGVKEVESFDSEEFLLQTVMGTLHIRGSNLQMKNLDVEKGIVSIKGKINGFEYIDENQAGKSKGIFSKLFK